MVMIWWLLRDLPLPAQRDQTVRQQLSQFDWLGLSVIAGALTCLLLALSYGGVVYSWTSPTVLTLLILHVTLVVGFVAIQWWKKEDALLPLRIWNNRNIAAGALYSFTVNAGGETISYYVSILTTPIFCSD